MLFRSKLLFIPLDNSKGIVLDKKDKESFIPNTNIKDTINNLITGNKYSKPHIANVYKSYLENGKIEVFNDIIIEPDNVNCSNNKKTETKSNRRILQTHVLKKARSGLLFLLLYREYYNKSYSHRYNFL